MKTQLLLKLLVIKILVFSMISCGDAPSSEAQYEEAVETAEVPSDIEVDTPPPPPPPPPGIEVEPGDPEIGNTIDITDEEVGTIGNTTAPGLENYKVVLSVDGTINMNENGVLVVWIGADTVEVTFEEGTVQDETTIPTEIGQYAKVTPFAPDFDIINPIEDSCYKIHPSGSEIRFSLQPKSTGTYNVSVNIQLYEADDCQGAFVPKTSETLSVIVDVNTQKEIEKKVNTLGEIVWEQFLKFWGALVALIFGAILFIIRKKIKKKTGYEEKVDKPENEGEEA